MVVLAVIFMPAGDLLLFRPLLLAGDLIYPGWFRLLQLRIEVLALLCHVILLVIMVRDYDKQPILAAP